MNTLCLCSVSSIDDWQTCLLGPACASGVAEGVGPELLEPITIAGWKWLTSGPVPTDVGESPSNSARALEVTLTWAPGGLARLSGPVHLSHQTRSAGARTER